MKKTINAPIVKKKWETPTIEIISKADDVNGGGGLNHNELHTPYHTLVTSHGGNTATIPASQWPNYHS